MRSRKLISTIIFIIPVFFFACQRTENSTAVEKELKNGSSGLKIKKLTAEQFLATEESESFYIIKGIQPDLGIKSLGGFDFTFNNNLDLVELDCSIFTLSRCFIDSNTLLVQLFFPHRDIDSITFSYTSTLANFNNISVSRKVWFNPKIYFKVSNYSKMPTIYMELVLMTSSESYYHQKVKFMAQEDFDYHEIITHAVLNFSSNPGVKHCDELELFLLNLSDSNHLFEISPKDSLTFIQ